MAQDDTKIATVRRRNRECADVRHGYEGRANKIQERHRVERKGDAFWMRKKDQPDEGDEPYRAVGKPTVHVEERRVGEDDIGNRTARALRRVANRVVDEGDTRGKKEHRVKNCEAELLLTGIV